MARAWVEATCDAQGVPVKVEDAVTVEEVAGLLSVHDAKAA
jgi:hypothetical protein